MGKPQKNISKFSDIPAELIVDVQIWRGAVNLITIPKPKDPNKLPKSIFLLKDGAKGRRESDFEKVSIDLSKGIDETLPPREQDPLALKKEEISNLKIPDFVYLNNKKIEQLYDAYNANPLATHRPIIEKMVTEHTKEGTVGAGLDLKKFLDLVFQEKEIIKYIKSIKYVEKTPEEKYPILIKELLVGDNIVLDLEFENRKSKELEKFDSLVNKLNTDFELEVSNTKVDSVRASLGRQTIEESLDNLRKADNKFAVVRAKFLLKIEEKEANTNRYYHFSYVNPIKGQVDQSVEIQFSLKESQLKDSWIDIYSRESYVDPNIFGIVYHSDWKENDRNTWLIKINPYAVYY